MKRRSPAARLTDIIESAEHVRAIMEGVTLEMLTTDWRARWVVERGIEIISEASKHLPDDLKARHPNIPWRQVAGIGNILRHDYRRTAPDILWHVIREDLAPLEAACRAELAAEQTRERKP